MVKKIECKFRNDFCQKCGKAISKRFICSQIPPLAIHIFVDNYGIIETMSPNKQSKRRSNAKYLGFTLNKGYPKTLNTGRKIHKEAVP